MKKMIWNKWKDPLAPLVYEKNTEADEFDAEVEAASDSFRDEDEPHYFRDEPHNKGLGPGIIGPQGFIPLNESNLPGKLFNFWIAHTNFPITEPIAKQIADSDGIEGLTVLSKYRFRIAIGKLFNGPEVRSSLQKSLCQEKEVATTAAPSPLTAIQAMLKKKHKFFSIYITKDKVYEYVVGETQDEVLTKSKRFDEVAKRVYSSWE